MGTAWERHVMCESAFRRGRNRSGDALVLFLSKMPVNTTRYCNQTFCCDVCYNFFDFIIEISALISSVGVLRSVAICARCSAVSSSSTCIPERTVWRQLFSVLQTLLQIFRDVTKTSFTFKYSCSFRQHACCAFVYKIGAAFPESIFNKLERAQQYYTGSSKKMDGIWNRYNLKSTRRIYTFGVLKCSEKFKVLDLRKLIILN